jgi:hypothetical protein
VIEALGVRVVRTATGARVVREAQVAPGAKAARDVKADHAAKGVDRNGTTVARDVIAARESSTRR